MDYCRNGRSIFYSKTLVLLTQYCISLLLVSFIGLLIIFWNITTCWLSWVILPVSCTHIFASAIYWFWLRWPNSAVTAWSYLLLFQTYLLKTLFHKVKFWHVIAALWCWYWFVVSWWLTSKQVWFYFWLFMKIYIVFELLNMQMPDFNVTTIAYT